jgi:DNA-binding MarR family transcriptional regulator
MKKAMRVLQEGGFILRVSAKRNGRSELVRLTAKGLAAADRVIAEIARVMEQVTIESRSTD